MEASEGNPTADADAQQADITATEEGTDPTNVGGKAQEEAPIAQQDGEDNPTADADSQPVDSTTAEEGRKPPNVEEEIDNPPNLACALAMQRLSRGRHARKMFAKRQKMRKKRTQEVN